MGSILLHFGWIELGLGFIRQGLSDALRGWRLRARHSSIRCVTVRLRVASRASWRVKQEEISSVTSYHHATNLAPPLHTWTTEAGVMLAAQDHPRPVPRYRETWHAMQLLKGTRAGAGGAAGAAGAGAALPGPASPEAAAAGEAPNGAEACCASEII